MTVDILSTAYDKEHLIKIKKNNEQLGRNKGNLEKTAEFE